ncbi:MAG: response regulator [bacterium]|nr:response regulator [bacterium]
MQEKLTTILLVEDNPGDVRLLRDALAETGGEFRLVAVGSLAEALQRLTEGGIEVVLLDLSLPDAHGLETVTQANAAAPRLPIVVLTGLEDEALAVQAVRHGAQDYLVKGQVNSQLLVRAIRYAVERKRAEEAVLASEENYRTLFDTSPDGIVITTLEGQIVDANRAFLEMLGYSLDELKKKNCREITPSHWHEAEADAVRTALETGHGTFEKEYIHKDGRVFPISLTGWGIRDKEGKPERLGAFVHDISARKKAEEEKRRLQEELAQAQKMQAIGTLAGGIAHEFNNINASVIGYVDLTLQTEQLSASARRNLETVRRSAARAADLTRSLLAFSRKEVGEKKPVSLKAVVDEVLRLTEKEFTSEGIEVTVSHSTTVGPIMGDPGLLVQVVMNLLINARHAMLRSPVKTLTIQTGQEDERPFIRVRDTGCGIPKENLPRIFEPFFTTKGALVSGGVYDGKAHGTGLGLSVCHSIVKGHGGEIKVRSQVDRGTTLTVYLPPSPKRKTTRRVPADGLAKTDARILIVDDEEAITDLLMQVLDRQGYAADGFTDPHAALAALSDRHYAMAIVDLQMPGMNGEELIGHVNRLPMEQRPLNVILTGRLATSHEEYAHLDVFAIVQKPFSTEDVLAVVEKGLSARAQPR